MSISAANSRPTTRAASSAAKSLFHEAVAAAKAGETNAARTLFERFTQDQPNVPQAWLWRAHLAADTTEKVAHLRQAQMLDPDQPQTRKTLVKSLVQAGIARAKASEKTAAREHLREATQLDPDVVSAWLWLASLADSAEERLHYIEKVLMIEPEHPNALAWKAELESTTAPPRPSTAPRVLIVDDSMTVRSLVKRTLGKRGMTVVTAADGAETMERLEESTPDLVILDIELPDTDGFELCRRIKSRDATKKVPVVMLSGKDGAFDKLRGKMVGAVDHVSKPFRPEDLMQALKPHIPGENA